MDTWKIFDSRGAEFLIPCDAFVLKTSGNNQIFLELHKGEEIVAVFVEPIAFFKNND